MEAKAPSPTGSGGHAVEGRQSLSPRQGVEGGSAGHTPESGGHSSPRSLSTQEALALAKEIDELHDLSDYLAQQQLARRKIMAQTIRCALTLSPASFYQTDSSAPPLGAPKGQGTAPEPPLPAEMPTFVDTGSFMSQTLSSKGKQSMKAEDDIASAMASLASVSEFGEMAKSSRVRKVEAASRERRQSAAPQLHRLRTKAPAALTENYSSEPDVPRPSNRSNYSPASPSAASLQMPSADESFHPSSAAAFLAAMEATGRVSEEDDQEVAQSLATFERAGAAHGRGGRAAAVTPYDRWMHSPSSAGYFSPVDPHRAKTPLTRRSIARSNPVAPERKRRNARLSQRTRAFSTDSALGTALDASFIALALASCVTAPLLFVLLERDARCPAAVVAWFVILPILSSVWMASRCFLQVRSGDWDVVDDFGKIRLNYLQGWLAYDLVFTLPLELCCLASTTAAVSVGFRHFLRLPRAFSLLRHSNPLVPRRSWATQSFAVVFMLLVVFAIILITASFSPWQFEDFYAIDLHNRYNLSVPQLLPTTPREEYSVAFYWTWSTLTSTGYGDYVVQRPAGRVLSIVVSFIGVLIFAVLKAFATSLVLPSKDGLDEQLREKRMMLHSMLRHYEIPWAAQKEVIALIPYTLEKDSELFFKQMMNDLPPFVEEKIEFYLRVKTLRALPLLRELRTVYEERPAETQDSASASGSTDYEDGEALLHDLAVKLHRRFVPAYHIIISAGDTGAEMFFLTHGQVEVLIEGPDGDERWVATLRSGAFFGEVALVEKNAVRTATVEAITDCEVMVLLKEDFEATIERCPPLVEKIREEQRKRMAVTMKAQKALAQSLS